MRDDIRTFLLKNRANESVRDFGDDDSLLESGVIDSVTMVDLLSFLESQYGIQIDDDEMTPENFDALSSIVAFVERQQARQQRATA